MILLLSGEGASDLGQCQNAQAQCEAPEFQLGPMAILADQVIERRIQYSLRSVPGAIRYIPKQALCERAKGRRGNQVSLTGKKNKDKETRHYFINAWMLGELAVGIQLDEEQPVLAILFRDCDGTHSVERTAWSDKHDSMVDGFQRAEFTRGIPMIPKPESEAWLLCAAKQNPYRHCAVLEDIPGNDASPNSAKRQLDQAFGGHRSAEQLCDWLDAQPYDAGQAMVMPSFAAFVEDVECALATMSARSVADRS